MFIDIKPDKTKGNLIKAAAGGNPVGYIMLTNGPEIAGLLVFKTGDHKTKLAAAEEAAKKENLDFKKVYQGFVEGGDAGLIFKVAKKKGVTKPPNEGKPGKLEKYLKKGASKSFAVTYEMVDNSALEVVLKDDESGAETPSVATSVADGRDDEQKWQAALKAITPRFEKAVEQKAGDVQNMRMVMNYAQEKGDGGDPGAALKSLAMLKKLLDDAAAAGSDPLVPWHAATKDARFQVRRLQLALRKYEQSLRSELKSAPAGTAEKIQMAMDDSLQIADSLDQVMDTLDTAPGSKKDVADWAKFLKSDLVLAVQKPNPFNLKVNITGPLSKTLKALAPSLGASQ